MSLNGIKVRVFRQEGYHGTLNDMERQFYLDAFNNPNLSIADTTDSTEPTNGALQTKGGLGVEKTIVAGLGIKLGGVDTENLLDYYEYGSFTPHVYDDSLSNTENQTYSIQIGKYVKIGRICHFSLELKLTSLGNLTTSQMARAANLPFVSASVGKTAVNTAEGYSLSLATGGVSVVGYIPASASFINLEKYSANTGTANFTLAHWSADGRMVISGSYITNDGEV